MAISPPSDLMLDVARAADPAKVREATAKLTRLAADPSATNDNFSKALAAATDVKTKVHATAAQASLRASAQPKADSYKKFEAVLLQSFVESMLPKDDELFGDKNSAGVYRSMMAEQLATQIANAGGIGLAKAVEKAHPKAHSAVAAPAVTLERT